MRSIPQEHAGNGSDHGRNQKKPIVRQDRISCDPERHTICVQDDLHYKVLNFGPFGLAIESDQPLDDAYDDILFCVDNVAINQLSLRKVNENLIYSGCVHTAFSIEGQWLSIEAVLSMSTLNEILADAAKAFAQDADLRDDFKLIVLEIKDMLIRLQNDINGLDKSSFGSDLTSIAQHENTIIDRVSDYLSKNLESFYAKVKLVLSDIDQAQLSNYYDYFRRNVGQIMYQASYAHRAYTKPKGYAGDFEMMNHVYLREARGDSLFGKCLQRYFVDEPAGKAVRNREKYLREKLKQTISKFAADAEIKILSVASGPALEVQNLIRDPLFQSQNVQITLFDQDFDALKHAQRKIIEACRSHKKNITLKLLNMNIKEVIKSGLPEDGFNLIYSAGLFDYFTDPVAVFAAQQLFKGLKKGGTLIIGNFSMKNPNQFAMGLIMDWNLIYRSEEKMQELFGGIGAYTLEQESQGINLFSNMIK